MRQLADARLVIGDVGTSSRRFFGWKATGESNKKQ
jgi:hypothetical protein